MSLCLRVAPPDWHFWKWNSGSDYQSITLVVTRDIQFEYKRRGEQPETFTVPVFAHIVLNNDGLFDHVEIRRKQRETFAMNPTMTNHCYRHALEMFEQIDDAHIKVKQWAQQFFV